jgi:cysteinyl-tRNA synthetase
MSKSLGNIYTLQDILNRGYSLDAFKLMILSKHYRTEGNFTWEILESFENRIRRWKNFACLRFQLSSSIPSGSFDPIMAMQPIQTLLPHLLNDLDTPKAISSIETYIDSVIVDGKDISKEAWLLGDYLKFIKNTLGLDLISATSDITELQKSLLSQRKRARIEKNWVESDRLRDELKAQGIGINDGTAEQIWYRL